MSTSTARPATVRTAHDVAGTAGQPLGSLEGVTNRVLWSDGVSMAGLLTVEGGHRLGAHTHRTHEHHYWVVDGAATVLGADMSVGSYAHIPFGVEHDIDASRTSGCTVFYVYTSQSG